MFIVIEGIDGAGCETQARLVFEKLKAKGKETTLLKYPNYNNPVGEMLRKFLYENQKLDAKQQFLLYSLQFIWDAEKIKKYSSRLRSNNKMYYSSSERSESRRLEESVLIADRYFTTTLCFQTLEGIDEKIALQFADNFGIIKPDLVFFLDVKPEIAIKRKGGEDKEKNFREKDFAFIQRTYPKYLDLVKRQVWTKWVRIDGEKKPDEIAEEIIKNI